MTQRTKANGFIYTQHSLLCFLSIVQVPRITSLFPRMTFRPLFSTMQTASLLSSHPVEAAMCGVAGAVYYLCERAFASRWKPAKVCLFLLALEITFTSMFPPRGAPPQLWQELQLRLGHCTWLTLISMCVGYLCVFNHFTGKRNQFWKDSKLKMQHHQIINGTDLKYYSTWRSCSKNPAKLLWSLDYVEKNKVFYFSQGTPCRMGGHLQSALLESPYIVLVLSTLMYQNLQNSYIHLSGKANPLKIKSI